MTKYQVNAYVDGGWNVVCVTKDRDTVNAIASEWYADGYTCIIVEK